MKSKGFTRAGSDQGRADIQTASRGLRHPAGIDHYQKFDEFQQSVGIEDLTAI